MLILLSWKTINILGIKKMVTKIVIGFVLALIGGLITFLFWKIEKKIDHIEAENERRNKEQINIRVAERELLIAEADISALTARCVRGEIVNGELEKAEKTLAEKKKNIESLTLKVAIQSEVVS